MNLPKHMTIYEEDSETLETPNESEDYSEDFGDDTNGEGEQPDVEALRQELAETKEKLEKATKDKNGILAKLKTAKQDVKTPDYSERLDKMELRSLDKELTRENVAEVLTYAKAKGITIEQAYNSSLIQAYLKADKTEKEEEDKLKKATPKASNRGQVSSGYKKYERTNDGLAKMLEEQVFSKN
jgi:hypothetical protein